MTPIDKPVVRPAKAGLLRMAAVSRPGSLHRCALVLVVSLLGSGCPNKREPARDPDIVDVNRVRPEVMAEPLTNLPADVNTNRLR